MPSQAKILVVITIYNAGRFLEHTLRSVYQQTFESWRCIAVDDGSTDGSIAVIENWVQRDSRFELRKQAKNGGVAASRNAGFSCLADENYVIFLDHDDVWVPTILEMFLEKLEHEHWWVAAYGECYVIDENGVVVPDAEAQERGKDRLEFKDGNKLTAVSGEALTFQQILVKNPLLTPGLILLRSSALTSTVAADGFLFNPDVPICDDWDLWVRVSRVGPFCYIDSPVIGYRRHGSNESKKRGLMARGARRVRSNVMNDPRNTSADTAYIYAAYRAWWFTLAKRRLQLSIEAAKIFRPRKCLELLALSLLNVFDLTLLFLSKSKQPVRRGLDSATDEKIRVYSGTGDAQ